MAFNSNNINALSLFHFTRKLDTLKQIVENGLRFSYAFEKYSAQIIANYEYPYSGDVVNKVYEDTGVAIPMVSFCDIPITRANSHMDKYGEYMIGLNKDAMMYLYEPILNPVLYIHSNNLLQAVDELGIVHAETTRNLFNAIFENPKNVNLETFEENNNLRKDLKPLIDRRFYCSFILGLVKPIYDQQTKVCYYDEREWRAFYPNRMQSAEWIWGIKKEYFDSNRLVWNEELSSNKENYITIPKEFLGSIITHIVTHTEQEIPQLIEWIINSEMLFGCEEISMDERLLLVSRVTSFERISLDY